MARDEKSAPPSRSEATEENVYSGVYHVLLVGMTISTVLFVIGIVRALMLRQNIPLTVAWVESHYSVAAVAHGLRTLDPTVLMMIATAVLILTPVCRVVVSIHAFAVDRDRNFVVVTSVVFVVMVLTVILGLLGLR